MLSELETSKGCFTIKILVSSNSIITYASDDFDEVIEHLCDGLKTGKYTWFDGIESNRSETVAEEIFFIHDLLDAYKGDYAEIIIRINESLDNAKINYIPFNRDVELYM